MKSILAHWRDYRDQVYPKGMTGEQNRQLHRAFFAGAWAALQESGQLAPLPDDQAVAALEAMHRECEEFCRAWEGGAA